jgi:phosphopentomutase
MAGRFGRAVVVVCDGLGVGAAPDAAAFGDAGSDTLGHVLASDDVRIPNLVALGLGNLTPSYQGARNPRPDAAFGKMAERSAGKDTTTGHWEMAGLITLRAFRTYPGGFPPEVVEPFERRIGAPRSSRSWVRSTCGPARPSCTRPETACSRWPPTRS